MILDWRFSIPEASKITNQESLIVNQEECEKGDGKVPSGPHPFSSFAPGRVVCTAGKGPHPGVDCGFQSEDRGENMKKHYLPASVLPALIVLSVSHVTAAPNVAPSPFGGQGVVAYWTFDDAGDQGAARDLAGGDNTVRLQGGSRATRVAGPFGRALAFTAPGQAAEGPDIGFPAGSAAGTISLWFNRPTGVADKVLFSYGPTEKGRARGLWIVNKKRLCFYFWGHPADLHCDIKGGITPDQWHHVAATYDGTTARLYYDGRKIGSRAVTLDTGLRGRFQLGRNLVDTDGRDFLGLIDEVAVFDRALSADEVLAHHAERLPAVQALPPETKRTYHAERGRLQAARAAARRESVARLGVKEIVFAVRQVDTDGHWYANFGYNINDPEKRRYYHDGGKLCRLNLETGDVTVLLDDPTGGVRDPQVHYDGSTILFSYREGGQPYYHLYEIGADPSADSGQGGTNLRRLTDGPYDDYEPAYLPDGGIVFCSSRCERWVPCYYTQVAILHRCDADGGNIRALSANVEHENTPWVLPDGRILYQRWEYVDRSQIGYHHLWTMNPDGTGQMVYYGNMHPDVVMIDAKPIPGTRQVVASFSPGHGRNEHAGIITTVDPRLGPDAKPSTRALNRKRMLRDPYPLGEDLFLAAGDMEIVLMDSTGSCRTLYELPPDWRKGRMRIHEPRPLRPRPREQIIPSRTDPQKATGTVILEAVHEGRNMDGVEPGEIKRLLVLEILPKPCNIFSGMEPLSYGGTFLLERVLGTVPVEPDGSAHIELPAMRALFFVALDENDVSVKRMQSFLTVQPGETLGCVGCHEQRTQTPRSAEPKLAMRKPPSRIAPIPGVPDVIDFPRDIQPILDRHCVACHDYGRTPRGGPMSGGIILAGDRGPMYSHSFYMLTIAAQFADGRNLRKSNYPARDIGSAASAILAKLDGKHHKVRATAREKRLVRLWTDCGSTYAGTYAALGTGSIGHYGGRQRPSRPDMAWESTRAAQSAMKRRCATCHKGATALPASPSDNKRLVPWAEGHMNSLATGKSQRKNPVFRFNRHLVYNLTRPKKSLLLLAPLARAAGGFGVCPETVFADRSDPDFRTLANAIVDAKAYLDGIKRFDMPGFQPRREWIREMQRYGLLPDELDTARTPIDVYQLEYEYWQSQWYRPTGMPGGSADPTASP
jgi:hypothetical protein